MFDRSLGSSSLIIAHELAHNLGVNHDGVSGNQDCEPQGFIMGPQLSPGATAWSACSRRQLARFISQYGDCLDNSPPRQSEWRHQHEQLPGQRFDGEEQCQLMYGPRWRLYSQGIINGQAVDICRAIWCRNYINLKSPNAAALQVSFFPQDTSQPLIWMREILSQGTECSEGRQCRSGECLAVTDLDENISTTSTPAPSTTTTERQERNRPFRILYSMKVCDFFKLLSPHNYPSFCND